MIQTSSLLVTTLLVGHFDNIQLQNTDLLLKNIKIDDSYFLCGRTVYQSGRPLEYATERTSFLLKHQYLVIYFLLYIYIRNVTLLTQLN